MNSIEQQDQVVIDPACVFEGVLRITNLDDAAGVCGFGVLFRTPGEPFVYRQAVAFPRQDYCQEFPDLKFPKKASANDVAERIESFLRQSRVTSNARNALQALRSFLMEGKVIVGSATLIGNECARVGL